MGKPTGFMEYQRKTGNTVAPLERIKNFKEFHLQLPKKEQQMQAARCMACGVPFCQAGTMIAGMASGCPLQNLVPEWNDLVYTGNWSQAYNRLKKTLCILETMSRHTAASPRQTVFRNLPPVSARHSAKQPVHAT